MWNAACDFLRLHEEKWWPGWIAYPSRATTKLNWCDGSTPCYSYCWIWLCVQLGLAVVLFLMTDIIPASSLVKVLFGYRAPPAQISVVPGGNGHAASKPRRPRLTKMMTKKWVDHDNFLDALLKRTPKFLSHTRTLENFIRNNTDPELAFPPNAPDERWVAGFDRRTLYPLLFLKDLNDILQIGMALALLTGAVGTYLNMRFEHEKPHISLMIIGSCRTLSNLTNHSTRLYQRSNSFPSSS